MGIQTRKIKYAKHWELIQLNEICEKITDGTHHTPTYTDSGVAFISVKDINAHKIDFSKCKFISKESHDDLIKRCYPEKEDLLVTKSGTIGRMAIVPDKPEFSLFVSVALIKNNKNYICTKFLKYCFENYFNSISIDQDIKGGLLKNFHLEDIRQTEIPIVSLSEQHRIVSKLEELFSELDKGVESLRTAQQQLKVYRQAVLKWAFEGRLTSASLSDRGERSLIEEPRSLSGAETTDGRRELPEGWKIVKLGEVIEKPKYGTSKKCDYALASKGVLRIPNIVDGVIDSRDLKYAHFDENEIEVYRLKDGDILTIRSNGSVDLVGKSALISKKDEKFLYAGYLIRLRPVRKFILPKYLAHILSSSQLRNQIESKAKSTSGVNNINSEELSSLIIQIPPTLTEQTHIVSEIESRLSVCDKIEESIEQSLKQAKALRQSILKQAFEGKLVPQDPNDEPASVLLERIRAEREQNQPAKKSKKEIKACISSVLS